LSFPSILRLTAGAADTTAGPDNNMEPIERRNRSDQSGKAVKGARELEFSAEGFLDSAGVARKVVQYRRGQAIFMQGDVCEDVMYVQSGGVKLSVLSKTGKEAVVAMFGAGDFFGEGCLAGQTHRRSHWRHSRRWSARRARG
jgi:CRP-like cAMP-binding protein